MSATSLEYNELIMCDLCKRRYNTNVYKRHVNENQCIKRNHRRLPFESIKQRTLRIGDKVFSIQQQQKRQKNDNIQIANGPEKRNQQIYNNNKPNQEKLQKVIPSNNRQRTLEQAKQLLELRTKYKPPWIHHRSIFTDDLHMKQNQTDKSSLQAQDTSNNTVNPRLLSKKVKQRFYSCERVSPSIAKLKNNDLAIKGS